MNFLKKVRTVSVECDVKVADRNCRRWPGILTADKDIL